MDKLRECPFCGGKANTTAFRGITGLICGRCGAVVSFKHREEHEQAISAWNARAEEPNKPLTLDELRKIDIFDWAWIEIIGNSSEKESAYYRKSDDYTRGRAFCCGYPGMGYHFEYEEYGKAWLAYKYKPKEDD